MKPTSWCLLRPWYIDDDVDDNDNDVYSYGDDDAYDDGDDKNNAGNDDDNIDDADYNYDDDNNDNDDLLPSALTLQGLDVIPHTHHAHCKQYCTLQTTH